MSFFTVTSYNIKEFVFTFLILSSRKTIEIYLKLTIIFILIQLKVFKQNSDYYSILWVEHTKTLDFKLRFSVWLGSNTAASYFSSGIDICIFLFYSMSVIILRDIIGSLPETPNSFDVTLSFVLARPSRFLSNFIQFSSSLHYFVVLVILESALPKSALLHLDSSIYLLKNTSAIMGVEA